jgi:hypothetical protein
MSRTGISFIALAFATLAACATGHEAMNGTVVMKVSETEAHVCIFGKDAPVGAQVQLFRHNCEMKGGATPNRYECTKQQVAIGKIATKMGGHYALVTFPQGTKIEDGYTVEPM